MDSSNSWKVVVGKYDYFTKQHTSTVIDFEYYHGLNVDFGNVYVDRTDGNMDMYVHAKNVTYYGKDHGNGIMHFDFNGMDKYFDQASSWIWSGQNYESGHVKYYPIQTSDNLYPLAVENANIWVATRDQTTNNTYILNPKAVVHGGFAYSTYVASEILLGSLRNIDAATISNEDLKRHLTTEVLKNNTKGANVANVSYEIARTDTSDSELGAGNLMVNVTINNGWEQGKQTAKTQIFLRFFLHIDMKIIRHPFFLT